MYLYSTCCWKFYTYLAAIVLTVLLLFLFNHKVRYVGNYVIFSLWTSIVMAFMFPYHLFSFKDVTNAVETSQLVKHVSKVIGIQWELRGADILEIERGAVIVSNHQTILDLLGTANIWKTLGKCAVVAKKELFYFWPFGLEAWANGTVFIDRKRANVANKQLDEASHLILKEKTKLWIFPEGTRNNNPNTLLPFKKGAFRIAVACQAPIIPIVYSPYYFIDHEKKYFGQGKVIIYCLDPIPTKGKTEDDVDSIIEEVREKMAKRYKLLTQEAVEIRTS